jgi:hypothetical protein
MGKHRVAVILLHAPVTNRQGQGVTTAVTNMDIHDISRTCRTYEVDHYYLVNPIPEQREVVDAILAYWRTEKSKTWHPDRFEALSRTHFVENFSQVKSDLAARYPDLSVEVSLPDARPLPEQESYAAVKLRWESELPGIKIIVLGTGGGVAKEFYSEVHTYLAPLYGPLGSDGYNHLSVRSAAAIILDRLFGK